jgi:hypothetical protein
VAAVPPGDDYKHGYVKNSNIHAQLENSDLYLNHYKHSIKIKHTHKHYLINKNSNVKNKKHKENYKRQF